MADEPLRMGEAGDWAAFRGRVAGRWQIPLFVASLIALGIAVSRVRPPEQRLDFDTLCNRIDTEIEGQMYAMAVDDAGRLLAAIGEGKVEDAEPGRANLLLARALGHLAERNNERDRDALTEIIETFRLAEARKQPLTWRDQARIGWAQERLHHFADAADRYERAIAGAGSDAIDLRRHLIELLHGTLSIESDALLDRLDVFRQDALELGRYDAVLWAINLTSDVLHEADKSDEALTFVLGYEDEFDATPLRNDYEFAKSMAMYRAGRFDNAELALRMLRNRLDVFDPLDAAAGWLLGRVVLSDGGVQRPYEAASIFQELVNTHGTGEYVTASRLGLAEALVAVEQFDEAYDSYGAVMEALTGRSQKSARGGSKVVDRDAVRTSLTVAAEQVRAAGGFGPALRFVEAAYVLVRPDNAELAAEYAQRIGDWRVGHARELRRQADAIAKEPERAAERANLLALESDQKASAATAFLELAEIAALNEPVSTAATWRAIELLDGAGRHRRTVELLRRFVEERPSSELIPRGLLRLGRTLQAMGRYQGAIEAYQDCQRRFPRTQDAAQTLIPLAECYLALGPKDYTLAEKTLLLILEDSPLFTPEAPEYADALYLYADLLTRLNRYEEAIPRLQEAKERYPREDRSIQAEFLLADAYRQSGLAMRADMNDAQYIGERKRMEAEHKERLDTAAGLFGKLVERFEGADPESLSELENTLFRYARLYEADCLFALGRFDGALQRYERAAWVFRETPSALAAYVQIVNCYAYLGQPSDARAALKRAQYLAQSLPASSFVPATLMGDRAEWEQYFSWVEQSGLF